MAGWENLVRRAPRMTERQLGPWRLGEKLGEGGNGIVWEAEHAETGQRVALKVIKTRKVDREPYQRFLAEIRTLRQIREHPRVLPLLDAHVPEEPSKTDKPWFVMPIASSLAGELQEKNLAAVVAAVATIAETLAALREEHRLAHRDIKPANLYWLEENALIGDFGLVALPDPSGLTTEGKPLGPTHFIPFEMLNEPMSADPYAADVYSLAKTLWVLASGVSYPPPGHQPADGGALSIGGYRPHPHSSSLDRLISRATQTDPGLRPSVEEVASDLRAWADLPAGPKEIEMAGAAAAVRERLASEIGETERVEGWKAAADEAAERLEELIESLDGVIEAADPRAELRIYDELAENYLTTLEHSGSPEILWSFVRASKITAGSPPIHYVLRLGRGVELIEGGDLIIRTMIDVGLDGVSGNDMFWRADERKVPVGSIEQEAALQEATEELAEKLQDGLTVFAEKAPSQ